VRDLYRLDQGQAAPRGFFKVDRDDSGNQSPLPGLYPDSVAPKDRLAEGPANREARR
jgi:hypothetical protein